ncbi:MAG: ABC transporter permease, partial [Spirulina sp.]
PVWHHVAAHVSERLARLPFVIVLTVLFFLLYPQALWFPDINQILLGTIATLMAVSLRFLLQHTSAMLSFWVERASAIEQFLFLFYLFFAGYIAPLDVFPPLVKAIAQWTPFPYFLYFPAAIFVGFPVEIGRGLIVMVGWGILLLTLNRWLWRKGLKQYSGMGA